MQLYQIILIFISLILITNINYTEQKKNIYNIPRVIDNDRIKIKNKSLKFPIKSILKNDNLYKLLPNKNEEIKKKENLDQISYSNKILDISKNKEIVNPQIKLINQLNKKENEKNKKYEYNSYWDNLNIGNFIDRDYINIQVNEFNKFNSDNNLYSNKEISKVYDQLTNGISNHQAFMSHDESIINDETKYIDGFSMNCKNLDLNNIEK